MLIEHEIDCAVVPSEGAQRAQPSLSFPAVLAVGALLSFVLVGGSIAYRFHGCGSHVGVEVGSGAEEGLGRDDREGAAGGAASAQDPGPPLSPREIAEKVIDSTAAVSCENGQGAGFFVEGDRLVTNAHVLCDDSRLTVELSDGRRMQGRVLRRDDNLDLALVGVAGADVRALELADASAVRTGDAIYAVGSPRGLAFTLSDGIVAHQARVLMGKVYVQVDATIHAGSSGGPLLDRWGRVIGVVTLRVREGEGMGLALASNYLFADGGFGLSASAGWDRSAWFGLNREAANRGREEREEALAILERPVLVQAQVDTRRIQAIVMMLSERSPRTLEFRVESDELSSPCRVRGEVANWAPIEALRGARLPLEVRRWLEREGDLDAAHAGAVLAEFSGCSPPPYSEATVILEGGQARMDRKDVMVLPPVHPRGMESLLR